MLRPLLFSICLCTAFSSTAAAERVQGDEGRADALVHQAIVAGRGDQEAGVPADLARAVELLREALALVPRASTAFNLAVTLESKGDHCEAVDLFERLADREFGELSAAQVGDVAARRSHALERTGTITVTITGAERGTIRVDERTIGEANENMRQTLCVDEGPHAVSVRADGYEPVDRNVDVDGGESLRLRLQLTERRRSLAQRPWFWIVGTIVALGAIGAVTAVVVTRQPDTVVDPVFGNRVALVEF